MSLYKRGKTWWARFTAPDGRRIQASCRTGNRLAAQEFHDQLKARLWREQVAGSIPEIPWPEAVIRWCRESGKKTLYNDKSHFRLLDPYLSSLTLGQVTREVIDIFIETRRKEGVKPATINRSLEVLRAVLNKAEKDWRWLDKAPRLRLLKEPQRRVRWLTEKEAAKLLAELPEHIQAMASFTLCTGLREANVTGLQWSQVDLKAKRAWIHPDQAKKEKAIGIPLNPEAVRILRDQQGKHETFVFTYGKKKPRPVVKAGTKWWRAAVKRVGLSDFRWHDLRHTWASWHVQRGTPLHVLQELGGWESYEMVRRYAHLSVKHLADYAGNAGTNLVQMKNGGSRRNKKGASSA